MKKRDKFLAVAGLVGFIALAAIAAMLSGSSGLDDPMRKQKWYQYCATLNKKIAQAYLQGYEPTDLIQQEQVCEQMTSCQRYNPPTILGDPCVPSRDPPPI